MRNDTLHIIFHQKIKIWLNGPVMRYPSIGGRRAAATHSIRMVITEETRRKRSK